jgi:hypothetical protein
MVGSGIVEGEDEALYSSNETSTAQQGETSGWNNLQEQEQHPINTKLN